MGENRNRGANRRRSGGDQRERRGWRTPAILAAIAVVVVGGFIAVVVIDMRQRSASTPPEGVETFEDLSRQHVQGQVSYPQNPPVGGEHDPTWQNCGFYEEPVTGENAVHSLEHGAVWITYRPDLPQAQKDELRQIASENSHVLVSPYPESPAPVVASAWGKQLGLESATASQLDQFVSAFQQGPQTPEPGASCSGGVGEPAVS